VLYELLSFVDVRLASHILPLAQIILYESGKFHGRIGHCRSAKIGELFPDRRIDDSRVKLRRKRLQQRILVFAPAQRSRAMT
jgi:hypothetical protein